MSPVSCGVLFIFHAASILASGAGPVPAAEGRSPPARSAILERALAGPLADSPGIVFCTRLPYDDGHWYANIGYYCDDAQKKAYTGNGRPDIGALHVLDPRTGQVVTIFDAKGGSVRDPQVHYDGRRMDGVRRGTSASSWSWSPCPSP